MKNDQLGTFIVITEPRTHSELQDIMFQTTLKELVTQIMGGLKKEDIVAVYPFERASDAEQFALGYLSEHKARLAIRPSPNERDNALALEIRGLLSSDDRDAFEEVKRRLAEHRLGGPADFSFDILDAFRGTANVLEALARKGPAHKIDRDGYPKRENVAKLVDWLSVLKNQPFPYAKAAESACNVLYAVLQIGGLQWGGEQFPNVENCEIAARQVRRLWGETPERGSLFVKPRS